MSLVKKEKIIMLEGMSFYHIISLFVIFSGIITSYWKLSNKMDKNIATTKLNLEDNEKDISLLFEKIKERDKKNDKTNELLHDIRESTIILTTEMKNYNKIMEVVTENRNAITDVKVNLAEHNSCFYHKKHQQHDKE